MRYLLLLVVLFSLPAFGEVEIELHGFSKQFSGDNYTETNYVNGEIFHAPPIEGVRQKANQYDYNQNSAGIGIIYNEISAGLYKDKFYNETYYVGYSKEVNVTSHFSYGVFLGGETSKVTSNGVISPFVKYYGFKARLHNADSVIISYSFKVGENK